MKFPIRIQVAAVAGLALLAAGCGEDAVGGNAEDARPSIVVTTNILGDVVRNLVGDEFDVVTIMPVGSDPHDFAPSAQQVTQIGEADALVVNGADFEEGLLDVIESAKADGVPTFEAISVVKQLELAEGGHSDEEEHDGPDPHFFTDPARMAQAAQAITDFLLAEGDYADVGVTDVDVDAVRATAQGYIDELEALDAEVETSLAAIADEGRILVTNHEVFGYFADRYGFKVVGAVIPSGSTAEGASAEALVELAETIEREGVRAIFADTSSSDELAQTLAAEVGDIAVVELFSESLGADGSEGATYLDMIRENAHRIADALAD